jgi:hypothetical protein
MLSETGSNRSLEIDGYQVTFVKGGGWQCNCERYEEGKGCRHVALAAALTTWESAVIAYGGSVTRH